MKCLCCGKPIHEGPSLDGWHKRCVKAFFGSSSIPQLDISNEVINQLSDRSVQKGFTVPGVQKKISLHLSKEEGGKLTLVDYPTGYILKPQTKEYPFLPEAEYLGMSLAVIAGIRTVPFALIRMHDEFAYITKRIDRGDSQGKAICFAMEDFCQLDERNTLDKYKGSYERCAKIIKRYSSIPELDLVELFYRILYFFVTGNSNMHLKNFSLIEKQPKSRDFSLSPCYNLLPVNIIMPEDTEELALTLCGKKADLKRRDFFRYANNIGLSEKVADNMIGTLVKKEEKLSHAIARSFLPDTLKGAMQKLLSSRFALLK